MATPGIFYGFFLRFYEHNRDMLTEGLLLGGGLHNSDLCER